MGTHTNCVQLEPRRRWFYGAGPIAHPSHTFFMTLASMTGFARATGNAGPWRLAWELKSVNAKGFDARLRLAPPFDAIEPDARARLSRKLNRGTIHAALAAQRDAAIPVVRINQGLLRELIAALTRIPLPNRIAPATLDGLLAVRGVVEIMDAAEDETAILPARASALDLLDEALDALVAMRQSEGGALALVLSARLEKIAALTEAADACPARKPRGDPGAPRAIACFSCRKREFRPESFAPGSSHARGQGRYQGRIGPSCRAHCRGPRTFGEGRRGRPQTRLHCPGLSREANTLCAKSNDANLTGLGLELRVEIEQFREQIQNIE